MLAKKLTGSLSSSPLVGFVTYRSPSGSSLSSVSIDTSSIPIKSGDVVIVICTNDEGEGGKITAFDEIYKQNQFDGQISASAHKKSATGPISSVLVEFDTPGVLISIIVAAFRGYTYNSYTLANGSTGLPNPPTIFTSVGDLVVACGHLDDEEVALGVQSGFTLVGNAVATSSTLNGSVTTMSYAIATATSSNPGAFTGSVSDYWTASTIRLTD